MRMLSCWQLKKRSWCQQSAAIGLCALSKIGSYLFSVYASNFQMLPDGFDLW
jgi:hypothetical protein